MSEDRQQEAQRNRESMPETARIVDRYRRTFGPATKIAWVQEGGREQGNQLPVERSMNADQWLHYVKTGEMPCSL